MICLHISIYVGLLQGVCRFVQVCVSIYLPKHQSAIVLGTVA